MRYIGAVVITMALFSFSALAAADVETEQWWRIPREGDGVELTICRSPAVAKPGEDCFNPAVLPDLDACKAAANDWRAQKFTGKFQAFCTDRDGSVSFVL